MFVLLHKLCITIFHRLHSPVILILLVLQLVRAKIRERERLTFGLEDATIISHKSRQPRKVSYQYSIGIFDIVILDNITLASTSPCGPHRYPGPYLDCFDAVDFLEVVLDVLPGHLHGALELDYVWGLIVHRFHQLHPKVREEYSQLRVSFGV